MSFRTPLLLAAGGPLAAGLALAWSAPWQRHQSHGRADAQERHIVVSAGYDPAEVHVDAGSPIRLVFRRQETSACSERVVFPELGISATLPAFADTTVELPAAAPGTYAFTCEMEMLHGRLIVEPSATRGRSGRVTARTFATVGANGAEHTAGAAR